MGSSYYGQGALQGAHEGNGDDGELPDAVIGGTFVTMAEIA